MRILAVDTSSQQGSVCIAEDFDILGAIQLASSIQHSERLFRSVEFLFQYMSFSLADIDLFVAARGPGSFTGLRVGLAAMEGFAAAHGKPGAGVTTLEALAWKTGVQDRPVVALIDARRGDVYAAVYRRVRDTLIEERPAAVLKPAEWFASLPRQEMIFCGDGAVQYRSAIEEVAQWHIHKMDFYLASTIAELAMGPNHGPLAPFYVRRADAEITRESIASPNS